MNRCPKCNRTDFGSRSGFSLHVKSCKATPPTPDDLPGIDSPPASGYPEGHLALCQWAIAHALTALREGDVRTARKALEEASGLAGMGPTMPEALWNGKEKKDAQEKGN